VSAMVCGDVMVDGGGEKGRNNNTSDEARLAVRTKCGVSQNIVIFRK
jgi:hypothetical protein